MGAREDVRVPVANGREIGAYLAEPQGDAPAPAVLVIHEILGLNEDMRRIADRFADSGYAALAPDVFEGRGPKPICIVRVMANLRSGAGPAVDDMLAARDWLAARPSVDADRIGVAGFCMGGGFALLLGHLGEFRVAAPYYGDVEADAERYRGLCPVVAGFGGRDLVFGRKAERLERHLQTLGIEHDIKLYPEAGHSYMSHQSRLVQLLSPFTPLRARYHEGAAEDSWRRMLAFFETHLCDRTSRRM